MSQMTFANLVSPAALARFLLTAAIGLALDLWTKWYAFEKLVVEVVWSDGGSHAVPRRPPYPFIPGWLEFNAHTNDGAVFGLGQGQRWLFVVISIAAIGFLTGLFLTSGRQRFYQFILGLLMAGVLGNMYDRVTLGYVRDMIHALPMWGVFPWIFNIADCLLCVGVTLMIGYSLFCSQPQATTDAAPAAPD